MSKNIDAQARAAVAMLTERSHETPVHRRKDLLEQGISDSLHVAMIRRGDLVRLRHGIYAVRSLAETSDPVERHRLDVAAAIAGGRERVWAFGASSALLHELPLPFAAPEGLVLVRESGADERALRQPSRHRLIIPDARVITGPIVPATTSRVRGVPSVGLPLAALSTAATLTSARWRVALFDAAMWRGFTPGDIEELIDPWRHLGHRGELLAALNRARAGAQTVLETFSRLAFVEGGLPEPILQQPFFDAEGLIGYADMWWPTLRVIGEADGLVKYATRADVIREKKREDRMRAAADAPFVRWTFEDIEQHPERVIAAIRRAAQRAA